MRLFEPIEVGARRIAHRVWMPPMCQYSALPSGPTMGQPTDWHVVHYGARALGGAAAVIVEATGVVPEGRISPYCLSLHSDEQIPAFARIADAIHAGGSTALIQLSHAGRKASDPVDWAVSILAAGHARQGVTFRSWINATMNLSGKPLPRRPWRSTSSWGRLVS